MQYNETPEGKLCYNKIFVSLPILITDITLCFNRMCTQGACR